jgi:predicted transcriptional regulator
MGYTRTYAMRSSNKPDWMIIAPINPLTVLQWKALFSVIDLMNRQDVWLQSVTVDNVSRSAGISKSTARTAIKKLCDMGLLRRENHRTRGARYYRKVMV